MENEEFSDINQEETAATTTENFIIGEEKLLSLDLLASYEKQLVRTTNTPQKNKPHNSRTPSGNSLSGQVKGIKDFLYLKSKKVEEENRKTLSLDHANYLGNSHILTESVKGATSEQYTNDDWECAHVEQCKHRQQCEHDKNIKDRKRKLTPSPDKTEAENFSHYKEDQIQVSANNSSNCMQLDEHQSKCATPKRYKMDEKEKANLSIEQFLQQFGVEESAKVINVTTVLEMFQRIMQKETPNCQYCRA